MFDVGFEIPKINPPALRGGSVVIPYYGITNIYVVHLYVYIFPQ